MNSNEPVYSQKRINIYTSNRKLYLVTGQRTARVYPIAVGKPETPTPSGTYHVITKVINPGGGLGTRWMGLDIPNGPYGIHGTFTPDSIGKAISNGCIRMYNQDVEELFNQVRTGTTVIIRPYSVEVSRDFAIYTIKPGDSLWGISRQLGISVNELAALNNIDDPDNLQVGRELKIPQK